jgi:hypothetical protein
MIAKMIKGRGFRGALEYDLQAGKSALLETNLASQTVRAMAHEFGEVRQLRPTLGKAVVHVSLSVHAEEHLTDAQWRTIAHRYLEGMGFTDNQYVVTRHTDTDHEHIHILANRITYAGEVVSDRQDWKRQEALMRVLEREYGLIAEPSSQEAERKAPTKGEIEYALRTGEASIKHRLQDLGAAAMQDCTSLSAYIQRLEAVGVEVIPMVQLDGAKVSGLMYRLEDTLMKGSDLGKAYSPAGLAKKGVTYAQDRDFATLERCREREARRAFDATTRDLAADETPERRGIGGDLGTLSASDGGVDGRDASDLNGAAAAEHDAGTGLRSPESGVTAPVGAESTGIAGSGAAVDRRDGPVDSAFGADPAPSDVAARVETVRGDRGDGGGGRAAHTRIVDLALSSVDARYPALEAVRDRTTQAVQRHLQAFGVDRVDLGIRDGQQGKMMQRLWTPEEVVQNVGWLKRMNAQGNDIYVKPAGEHGLVLVDDLTPAAVDRLQGEGFDPAVVTETSPANLQAWLKVSVEPLEARHRTLLAQWLAQDFGGDPNSADGGHYGRLAGFTNQKPNRRLETGLPPYVRLREWGGQVMTQAEAMLAKLDRFLDEQAARQEQQTRLAAIDGWQSPRGWPSWGHRKPVDEYHRQAQALQARYPHPDWSKLDWMIAKAMAGSGQYTVLEITQALVQGSPNLATRKPGHLEDYAQRTVAKAWEDPAVQAQRAQNLARQADRGWSR